MSKTLGRIINEMGQEMPRSLWHAYLFYFSGKACLQALQTNGLPDYEMYIVRNRVFRQYLPLPERYLPDYLNGKATRYTVSKQLIESHYRGQH